MFGLNHKRLFQTLFFSALAVFGLSTCGGGGGGASSGETCPGAEDLYSYAQSLHKEAIEKVRFGSTWEATYKIKSTVPLRITRLAGGEDNVFEGSDYQGTTRFTFTVPGNAPDPLSCQEVQAIQTNFGTEDSQALRSFIAQTIEAEVFLELGLENPITGSGNHSEDVGKSYTTRRSIYTLTNDGECKKDNPCTLDRWEQLGCNPSNIAHSVNADLYVGWRAGEDATFSISIQNYTPSDEHYTQIEQYPDYHYESSYPWTCAVTIPVCDGPISYSTSCGNGYQGIHVTRAPNVNLIDGSTQTYSFTNDYGKTEQRIVDLKCTSGCECNQASDCDDGKECTRDECNAGNCKNTPDDSIKPEQVIDDCRYCENGEVVSTRETAINECERIKKDAIYACSSSNNWLVHWTAQFGSQTQDAHYCKAGVVEGDSELTICNGQGVCSVGAPVTTNQGSFDMSCQNYNGQYVQLLCDVLCTRCQ